MTFPVRASAPTGTATLVVRVRRDSDGFFLDFFDYVFKAAGHTTPSLALTEPDAVNFPGLFQAFIAVETVGSFADGRYVAHVRDTALVLAFAPIDMIVRGARTIEADQVEVAGIAALASSTGNIQVLAWLVADGRIHLGATSMSASLYDASGALLSGPLVDAGADAQGTFTVTFVAPVLTLDAGHYVVASITAGGVVHKGNVPFVVYDL